MRRRDGAAGPEDERGRRARLLQVLWAIRSRLIRWVRTRGGFGTRPWVYL